MYRDWPFFRTLLSNMDMVLAKSSVPIASRYADLVRSEFAHHDLRTRGRRARNLIAMLLRTHSNRSF